jgi:hypothetical protein
MWADAMLKPTTRWWVQTGARWEGMRCVARLDEGGVELAGDAGGSWDLVLPGAVAQQLASCSIDHHLLTCEEAQAHYERALHLSNRTPLSHKNGPW